MSTAVRAASRTGTPSTASDLVALVRREVVLHPVLKTSAAHAAPRHVDDLLVGRQDRQSQLSGSRLMAEHMRRAHRQMCCTGTRAGPAVVRIEGLPHGGRHVDTAPDRHPASRAHQPVDVRTGHPRVEGLPPSDESALACQRECEVRVSVVPFHAAEAGPAAPVPLRAAAGPVETECATPRCGRRTRAPGVARPGYVTRCYLPLTTCCSAWEVAITPRYKQFAARRPGVRGRRWRGSRAG